MWGRFSELLLAFWLAVSPLVLGDFTANRLVCSVLVAFFALLSFRDSLRRMHLLTIGIALWLWAGGYATFPSLASPAEENDVIVALLLFMFAIVPSDSHLPSRSWDEFDPNSWEI